MEKLSRRLAQLAPSATVAMNQKTKDLQAQGIDIINLSVGEPDLTHPIMLKLLLKRPLMIIIPFIPRFRDIRNSGRLSLES